MNIVSNQNFCSVSNKIYNNFPSFKAKLEFKNQESRDQLEAGMAKLCSNDDKDKVHDLVGTIVKYFEPVTKDCFGGKVLLEDDKIKYQAPGDDKTYDTGFWLCGQKFLSHNGPNPYIDLNGKTPLEGISSILGYLYYSDNEELKNQLGDKTRKKILDLKIDLNGYPYRNSLIESYLKSKPTSYISKNDNTHVYYKISPKEREVTYNPDSTFQEAINTFHNPDASKEDRKKALDDLC